METLLLLFISSHLLDLTSVLKEIILFFLFISLNTTVLEEGKPSLSIVDMTGK